MILQEVQQIKTKISELAQRAVNDGVMTEEELRQINERLEQEKIVVGICGQVKSGKTTFINALLFGKNILPVASTPMTASLCYLSYGERPEVEVEFFTKQDWEQITKSVESSDKETSQSAKEFIESSRPIQNEINSLLGTKKIIDFDIIGNFVGSKGRYTPLVKSLKIKLPEEILKGIELVDTPGINDPVVSRERRTTEFLQGADVVFLFIYSGRPFDETDMKFMRRIKNSAGKVVVVVNKKDEICLNEGNIEAVKYRLIKEFDKLIDEAKRTNESKFTIELIDKAKSKIVFFSSLWALLGKMSEVEIIRDEDMRFHYERFKDDFPVSRTPDDFLRESGMDELENSIREILKDKFTLIKSTTNPILSSYKKRLDDINVELDSKKTSLNSLSRQKGELEKELESLNRINDISSGFLEESINKIKDKIFTKFNSINLSINQIFSLFPSTLERVIPKKSFLSAHESYQRECEVKFEIELQKLSGEINKQLSSFAEINELIYRELNDFFNHVFNLGSELLITKDFFERTIGSFKDKIFSEISKIEILQGKVSFQTSGWWIFGRKSAKSEVLKQAFERTIQLQTKLIGEVQQSYDKIRGEINQLKERFKVEISDRIKKPIQEALINYNRKDEEIKKYNEEIEELERFKSELETKYNSVKNEVNSIMNFN